jgi:hypothetical protein
MSTELTRQAAAIPGRSAKGQVTGKLRRAIIEMVWCGSCRDDAAKNSGMTIHGLREALRKPHVKQFYLRELDVLKTSERARNVLALVDVRDNAQNSMARVQAAARLEEFADKADQPASGRVFGASPGFCIILRQPPREAPLPSSPSLVIEHEPAPVPEPPAPLEPVPQPPAIARATPRSRR